MIPRPDDQETMKFALSIVKGFNTAIDVGAADGGWIRFLVDNFSSIHAFEPNRESFDRLDAEFQNEEKVKLHNIALMDKTGSGEMSLGKLKGSYIVPQVNGKTSISTLDGFDFESCSLLKIDAEGSELPILKGAKKLISRFRPVIVTEFKKRTSERFGWNFNDLTRWFVENKYRVAFRAYPNLVCVPRENGL